MTLLVILCSCNVTRTSIGNYPLGKQENSEIYSRVKQRFLLRGAIPLGFTQVKLPPEGNYQLKTSTRFIDVLFSALTYGLYSQQTIEVLIIKK